MTGRRFEPLSYARIVRIFSGLPFAARMLCHGLEELDLAQPALGLGKRLVAAEGSGSLLRKDDVRASDPFDHEHSDSSCYCGFRKDGVICLCGMDE